VFRKRSGGQRGGCSGVQAAALLAGQVGWCEVGSLLCELAGTGWHTSTEGGMGTVGGPCPGVAVSRWAPAGRLWPLPVPGQPGTAPVGQDESPTSPVAVLSVSRRRGRAWLLRVVAAGVASAVLWWAIKRQNCFLAVCLKKKNTTGNSSLHFLSSSQKYSYPRNAPR